MPLWVGDQAAEGEDTEPTREPPCGGMLESRSRDLSFSLPALGAPTESESFPMLSGKLSQASSLTSQHTLLQMASDVKVSSVTRE